MQTSWMADTAEYGHVYKWISVSLPPPDNKFFYFSPLSLTCAKCMASICSSTFVLYVQSWPCKKRSSIEKRKEHFSERTISKLEKRSLAVPGRKSKSIDVIIPNWTKSCAPAILFIVARYLRIQQKRISNVSQMYYSVVVHIGVC